MDTDHEFKTATASTICTCEPADSGTDELDYVCICNQQTAVSKGENI